MTQRLTRLDKRIAVNFTPEQIAAYSGARFLIGGGRASGRTYVLAVGFLQEAIERIGDRVKLFDHHSSSDKSHMFKMIQGIFNSSPELVDGYKLTIDHGGYIKINIK